MRLGANDQSDMKNPAVSIITPMHNSAAYLAETIKSVQAQSLTDFEMLLVDDCSIDTSVQIVQSFSHTDSRIKLLRLTRNSGAAVARNTAIEAATGRYIAFLDSDDLWLPSKLEHQVIFMQKYGLPFSWTSYELVNEFGAVQGMQPAARELSYTSLLRKQGVIGCLTAMYDTSFYGKQYMPNIRMRQDYGLWLRLLREAAAHKWMCDGLPEVLGQYRVHGRAMTYNKARAAYYQWRLYRDVERLSFMATLSCFARYILNGVLNKFLRRN